MGKSKDPSPGVPGCPGTKALPGPLRNGQTTSQYSESEHYKDGCGSTVQAATAGRFYTGSHAESSGIIPANGKIPAPVPCHTGGCKKITGEGRPVSHQGPHFEIRSDPHP